MITRDQVVEYLNSLNQSDLESIFQEYVEYTNNYILEDTICSLENKVDELTSEIEYLRDYKNGYYE